MTRPPPPDPPVLPERIHLPLLTMITQQSLDEDYLVAAERRAAGAPRAPRGRPQRVATLVAAMFGILVATAFVQTSRNADVDDEGRTTLISRLETERDRLARQQEQVADLRERNLELEAEVGQLADTEQEMLVTNRSLEIRTGFLRVTGQGVRVTITDRPDADQVQLVQHSDLALLVNGLWEAGAEAISVNGQRLTARTGISTSGEAIEVNTRGVSGPYVVEAVGDQRTLSARLFDTTSGLMFAGTADRYGFTYAVQNVDQLSLPSGPLQLLTRRTASTEVTDPGMEDQPPPKPTTTPSPPPTIDSEEASP